MVNTLFLELDAACDRGELTLLTTDNVQPLIVNDTRIQIINYGYAGQYNVDEFIPSCLAPYGEDGLELLAEDGRKTGIRYSKRDDHGDHAFYMGDIDRGVMFRVVK